MADLVFDGCRVTHSKFSSFLHYVFYFWVHMRPKKWDRLRSAAVGLITIRVGNVLDAGGGVRHRIVVGIDAKTLKVTIVIHHANAAVPSDKCCTSQLLPT